MHREMYETVAGVVNLQVVVGKDQWSRVQKPYGQWVTMLSFEVSFVRTFFVRGIQTRRKLSKDTGLRWCILQLGIWRHLNDVLCEARNCRCRIAKRQVVFCAESLHERRLFSALQAKGVVLKHPRIGRIPYLGICLVLHQAFHTAYRPAATDAIAHPVFWRHLPPMDNTCLRFADTLPTVPVLTPKFFRDLRKLVSYLPSYENEASFSFRLPRPATNGLFCHST